MLTTIILAIIIFAAGFVTGFFVFRNNKAKAEKIATKVDKTVDKVTTKVESAAKTASKTVKATAAKAKKVSK